MKVSPRVYLLLFLLMAQFAYSFIFPSCGFTDNWLPISSYLAKFQSRGSDNFLVSKLLPFISNDYRLNSDVGNYVELGLNFTRQFFQGHVFLNRPLYPFLIFLVSLPFRIFITPSYGLAFACAILLNFILIASTVCLFYWFVKRVLSQKAAFLASLLLIFSPFSHLSIIQPMAEMLMAFAVMASVCLLYIYIKNPSWLKLVFFSFIIGLFMLGKMFFAIGLFIFLLALYFKRFKEGLVFLALQFLPLLLWYLWVTKIWQMPYYSAEVQHWGMGVWLLDLIKGPWFEMVRVILFAVPNFFKVLIYGFLLIPVFFSAIGWRLLPWKDKAVFYFAPFLSIMALEFLVNLYSPPHAFLLFPIVYPTAILGIERADEYLKRFRVPSLLFTAVTIAAIIIISNLDIYQIFSYLYLM